MAKLLKENTMIILTTNKQIRLRDVLFGSITHPEAKRLTEDIQSPFKLLEAVGKFFGAPNTLTNECILSLGHLQQPTTTPIMNTNCGHIVKQIRVIKDGPGIGVWNDFLLELQISKAFTREQQKSGTQDWQRTWPGPGTSGWPPLQTPV